MTRYNILFDSEKNVSVEDFLEETLIGLLENEDYTFEPFLDEKLLSIINELNKDSDKEPLTQDNPPIKSGINFLEKVGFLNFHTNKEIGGFIKELESRCKIFEKDTVFSIFSGPPDTPKDPLYKYQWNLKELGIKKAWELFKDYNGRFSKERGIVRPKITVAVIDSGIDYCHPELKDLFRTINWGGEVRFGINFTKWPVNFKVKDKSTNSHGTSVAAMIVGIANDKFGRAAAAVGMGPENQPDIKLLNLKAFNKKKETKGIYLCRAILFASLINHVKVINCSWGPKHHLEEKDADLLKLVIDIATKDCNKIVVFAAGNHGQNIDNFFPANYSQTIAVGACTRNGTLSQLSNWGEKGIDVIAPGKNVLSLSVGGGKKTYSGTSLAAAQVSGLLGLLYALYPIRANGGEWNVDLIRNRLEMKLADNKINAPRPLEAKGLNYFDFLEP